MNIEVIEKIKKLLRLGESPNENEARAAIMKAQELAIKEGIEISSISTEEKPDIIEAAVADEKWDIAAQNIGCIVIPEFRCTSYRTKRWNETSRRYTIHDFRVIGYPQDVEIAKNVLAYTIAFYRHSWAECSKWYASRKGKATAAVRNAHLFGFCQGLTDAFTKNKMSYALVVTNDHAEAWLDAKSPNMPEATARKLKVEKDRDAIMHGYNDGKEAIGTRRIEQGRPA